MDFLNEKFNSQEQCSLFRPKELETLLIAQVVGVVDKPLGIQHV
jgi:hypothetical protein